MKKVIIIGCPGSGKTTFAEKLSRQTKIPLVYLDAIWHKADRTHISRDEFDQRLSEFLSSESWIIDGNYSRTLERRLCACDTVFFFDLSSKVCLQGAVSRLGQKRKDLPWIDYKLDPTLKKKIEDFQFKTRPSIYQLLEQYKESKEIIIFKSRSQAEEYLTANY